MNSELVKLLEAIEFSPLLEDEQKWSLIFQLEKGEPYSPELATAIVEFGRATVLYLNLAEDILENYLHTIDEEMKQLASEKLQENPQEIQEKARKIIKIVNDFMAEASKLEKALETKIENVVHEKAEGSEIDALHRFLHQPKDRKSE